MGRKNNSSKKAVLDFLKARPGERFTASAIAAGLGSTTVVYARKAANLWHEEGLLMKAREGSLFYYWYEEDREGRKSVKKAYDTRQRREVLIFFQENSGRCFTAEEVAERLSDIGRSTVYRVISVLSDEGRIMKSTHKGRRQSWQYADKDECQTHLHVECEGCGRIEHLDKESTERILRIVESVTGYRVLKETVLHGLCPDCRVRGK